MTPERKKEIWAMCYRQVSEIRRKTKLSPEDEAFLDEVLDEKRGKVSQGRHLKRGPYESTK